MQLEPDFEQAVDEQQEITRIVLGVLARIGFSDVGAETACYPGLIAAANVVQRLPPDATAAHRDAAVSATQAALIGATVSLRRARGLGSPVWAVDLPEGEPHLDASLKRALAQIPPRPDRVIDVRVAGWTAPERVGFCAAAALLAESWPQMLAELKVGIRQVALLRGHGITGFSDFAVQGAVFVNAERLGIRDGLPGTLRLAESLVHEGAHTRCYSAAVQRPFLRADRAGVLVDTPLRADARPLWGLFQQLVVLCRCAELYHRVDPGAGVETGIRTRKVTLIRQAKQALDALRVHTGQLSDHGQAILDEATTAIAAVV